MGPPLKMKFQAPNSSASSLAMATSRLKGRAGSRCQSSASVQALQTSQPRLGLDQGVLKFSDTLGRMAHHCLGKNEVSVFGEGLLSFLARQNPLKNALRGDWKTMIGVGPQGRLHRFGSQLLDHDRKNWQWPKQAIAARFSNHVEGSPARVDISRMAS